MSYLFGYAAIVLAVIVVILPAKWDPAIRLKEWVMKKEDDNDHN